MVSSVAVNTGFNFYKSSVATVANVSANVASRMRMVRQQSTVELANATFSIQGNIPTFSLSSLEATKPNLRAEILNPKPVVDRLEPIQR